MISAVPYKIMKREHPVSTPLFRLQQQPQNRVCGFKSARRVPRPCAMPFPARAVCVRRRKELLHLGRPDRSDAFSLVLEEISSCNTAPSEVFPRSQSKEADATMPVSPCSRLIPQIRK